VVTDSRLCSTRSPPSLSVALVEIVKLSLDPLDSAVTSRQGIARSGADVAAYDLDLPEQICYILLEYPGGSAARRLWSVNFPQQSGSCCKYDL
jgi:hypothetical protein